MKFNRQKLHKISTRYERIMKDDYKRSANWIHWVLKQQYGLPSYKGTKYRGAKHWLAKSDLYWELRKLERKSEDERSQNIFSKRIQRNDNE